MKNARGSLTGFAAALAVVVLLNAALHGVRLRADFSRGRVYSVSPASLNYLRALRAPVTVEVYSTPELPAQLEASKDYLLDLLDELRDGSDGKLRIVKIAVDSPEASARAERAGVPGVRLDVVERDKFETREGRLGVRLFYGKSQRVLPFVSDAATLEYDLVGRIRQMADTTPIRLGFSRAAGALGYERLPTTFRRQLLERYDAGDVELSTDASSGFAPGLKVLALMDPSRRFSERELYALDRFTAAGGALLLALDAKTVDLREFVATPRDVGLSSFTASRGFAVRDSLVFDAQNQPIQVTVPQGREQTTHLVQYPPFVLARDFAAHPATRGLSSVVMPFASPVEFLPRSGITATPLVRSSAYSWLAGEGSAPLSVSPFALKSPSADVKTGPFVLAAALEGIFAPFYAAPPKGVKASPLIAKPGRIIVVGSSHFVDSGLVVPDSDYVFLLDILDWLAADDALIAIRTKSVAFAPLAEIAPAARAAVRWGLILVPPLLAVLFGLVAWRLRLRARHRLEARYGTAA